MLLGVGFGALGKSSITHANTKKAIAIIFTYKPARPRLKRDGGRDSPRSRLAIMHPITMK
jgi:hypothetical protein